MLEKRRIKAWQDMQAAAHAAFEQADTTIDLIRGSVSERCEPDKEERLGPRLGPHYHAGIISEQLRAGLGISPRWNLLRVEGGCLKPLYQQPALIGARLLMQSKKQITVAVHLWVDPSEWTNTAWPASGQVQAKPEVEDQWVERTLHLVADNVFQHEDAGLLWSPDAAMSQKIRAAIDRLRQSSELGLSQHRRVLGVSVGASPVEIKAAWRRYAAEHHPDRGGDTDQFRRGRLAYKALVG